MIIFLLVKDNEIKYLIFNTSIKASMVLNRDNLTID